MRHIISTLTVIFLCATSNARPWLNSDGKSIEADYVSSDGTEVVLLMGKREVKYPINKLSEADQSYIAEMAEPESSPKTAVETGLLKGIAISSALFPKPEEHFADRTRKSAFKACEAGAFSRTGKTDPDEWIKRDKAADLCDIYIPKTYDGTESYGLLLYISASDDPKFLSDWFPLFDEMKLIAVTPHKTGNNNAMIRRVMLAVDAFATVRETYNIDTDRQVVTGISGGGHMAMLTCAMYPELFKGAVSYAAQSYLPVSGFGHFPGFDLRDFKSGDRKVKKWVVISGDKDKNYKEILKTSKEWEDAHLDYRFIDVPGMAHTPAAAPDLKSALDWIGL